MAFSWNLNDSHFPDYCEDSSRCDFNAYAENGGSIVAIAGDDFAVIGADTRLSAGFSICTRNQNKLFKISDKTVLGCTGCWCDTLTLNRIISSRTQMYEQEHHEPMSTAAAAQMLSTMLYFKRFFPYGVWCILAGLDKNGNGCVYNYDPVGHCQMSKYYAQGSSGQLLQPLLDNQIGFKNMLKIKDSDNSLENTLDIIKDVFISAAERDIFTGDAITINIIQADGLEEDVFQLRKD